jgi:HlyD family secretion protein
MATNKQALDWLIADAPVEQAKAAHPLPRKTLAILAAAVLAVTAAFAWHAYATPSAPAFGTATIQRADIVKTISATGKLQALTTVQVGTQVSGTVSALYADFNQEVKKGQVIARLEPDQFQAQLTQAQANQASTQAAVVTAQNNVATADASIAAAQANLDRTKSVVDDSQNTYDLTQKLVAAKVSAAHDLQTAQAALNQAVAQRQQALAQVNQAKAQALSAQSQLAQSKAQELQAKAAVDFAAVNLQHAIITAPIDGTVISRNVDIGQTVAASLQAPTLFVIANDLARMQVLADIDEADVGQLAPNAQVNFTVDAYPTETFHGSISQVRLSPNTVQNVTTYTAVIDVANPDLKLKPGMTANVSAIAVRRDHVLAVPNAALRFRPGNTPTVWRVGDEDKLQPVRVKLGLSDGIQTEVVSGDVHENDRLAIATAVNGKNSPQTVSPFQPSRPGGRK